MNNNQRKYTFWDKGVYLQEISHSISEAKANMEKSCTCCNKASLCRESKCPILRAHKVKLLLLEAEELTRQNKVKVDFVKTREYNLTPKGRAKKRAQNYLSSAYKKINEEHKVLLAIDQASVEIELEEYSNAIQTLKNNGLKNLADHVLVIFKEEKLEVK